MRTHLTRGDFLAGAGASLLAALAPHRAAAEAKMLTRPIPATGEALPVIRRRARRVGAPLAEVTPPALLRWDRDGIEVDLARLGPTRIALRGRHQAENAAVADAVLDALGAAGIARVPDDARRTGYSTATWPGRLELLHAAAL